MLNKSLLGLAMLVLLPAANLSGEPAVEGGVSASRVGAFVGLDLYLVGDELVSYQSATGEHILVFRGGFSMSIGTNLFSSDNAVVWLESVRLESRGRIRIDYESKVYLQGNVSVKKDQGARGAGLSEAVIGKGQSMVVRLDVSGEVFVTAEKRRIEDPRGWELYKEGLAAVEQSKRKFVIRPEARVPTWAPEKKPPVKGPEEVVVKKPPVEKPVGPPEEVVEPVEKKPKFMYPINIAPAGETPPILESEKAADGTDIWTVIGRFYISQKQDEAGGLLELQADSAVIFIPAEQPEPNEGPGRGGGLEEAMAAGGVQGIYLSGDVVMTEGPRTIRADEMYYDFPEEKALAINAEMRSFDLKRGIPIYFRAAEVRQLAENKFAAENATMTSSEFHRPQILLNVASAVITDTTPVDARAKKLTDSSYEAELRDIRLKVYGKTVFSWPYLRTNLQRSDIPLKSIHAGHDSDFGTLVETRWYLSRLLGLREPEGVESTFALDYYGKRGVGTGAEIDYVRENCFGRMLAYIIHDSGDDDLGRHDSRRNIKPPRELRGRFFWQHRHFLPHSWQLTTEVSYASDEHFIEGYYRGEFNVGKEQETLVHLKRIEDNWGISILGKMRINDFVSKLEELPTVAYHLAGQSIFDDKLTFYSDSQVSRYRQRTTTKGVSEPFFTYMSERAELDMPLTIGRVKVVPFVAGTYGFEDGSGFNTRIDGSTKPREDDVWIGEAGARISLQPWWKVYPKVKSRVWDLNELRHIVRPYLTVVTFTESDSVVEQRDVLNIGLSQRLQTRRGRGSKERTVDWMRLDTDVTWVSKTDDPSASGPGPDRFIWNNPFIPLDKRRSSHIFGPRRNYFGADYLWRLSDTTAILGDMNYDMQSGVVQQMNVGFSHLRWPNLSYYIGSRYLRRINNTYGEKGSNAFTFAATYVLDPRYTVVFSQQFDFDYGAAIRSDIALLRRYHRMYWGLTYSADESLKKQAIVFSIWPQGVRELAFGPRRYMGLGGMPGF
ncbi:MAG: LPS-assembly protein LptD [Planctomycetota bacterium]|jgi:hypothetical protein